MVEWCTQNLRRGRQQFHVAPAMQGTKERYQYTTSVNINNTLDKNKIKIKEEERKTVIYSESHATCAQ